MTYLTSVANGVDDAGNVQHDSTALTVSGTNKVMWALVGNSDSTPADATSVVWDPGGAAQALTQQGATLTFGTFAQAQLFRLIAPANATASVRATWAATKAERWVIVWVETDIDQATPNGTVAAATGTAGTVSAGAVTTAIGQRVINLASALRTAVFSGPTEFDSPTGTERHDGVLTGTAYDAFAAQEQTASGVSTTPTWGLNETVDGWASFAFAVNVATGGGAPTITSTSSATPQRGAAHTVTGSSFGATQGTKQLRLGGVVQTPTSWADGSITYTLAADLIKSGVAVNVEIWETSPSDSLLSNSFALTSIQPAAGWSFVNVGTPNTTAANRLTFAADAASGDQAEWFTDGGKYTVDTDLSFSATGYGVFGARLWSSPDGFGAAADQVVAPWNTAGTGRVTRPALTTGALGVGPLLSSSAPVVVAVPQTATAARAGVRANVAATKGVAAVVASRAGARADQAATKATAATAASRAGVRASQAAAKGASAIAAARAGARADLAAAKGVASTTAARAGARADVAAVAAVGRSTSADARVGVRADTAATKAVASSTATRAGVRADLAAAKAATTSTSSRAGARSSVTAVAATGRTASTDARAGVRADVAATKAAQATATATAGARGAVAAAKAAALATSGRVGVRGSVAGVPVSGITTSTGSRAGARASVAAVRGAIVATSASAGVRASVGALKAAQAVTQARAGVMGANAARKAASTTAAARVGVRGGNGGTQLLPFIDSRFYKLPVADGYYTLPPRSAYLNIE